MTASVPASVRQRDYAGCVCKILPHLVLDHDSCMHDEIAVSSLANCYLRQIKISIRFFIGIITLTTHARTSRTCHEFLPQAKRRVFAAACLFVIYRVLFCSVARALRVLCIALCGSLRVLHGLLSCVFCIVSYAVRVY